MHSIALFINHRTLPSQRDDVRAVWERYMRPAIASNGAHEAYFYCYDANDPDVILVYQQYTDTEASLAFLEGPSYKNYLHDVEPLLATQPEVRQATPMWTKTLEQT